MAFRELQGLDAKLYLSTKVDQLAGIYRAAQKNLLSQLNKVDITSFQKYRTEAILQEVNIILRSLDYKARRWATEATPYAYGRGVDLAAERLKALRVTTNFNYDAQIHSQAVNILADNVTIDLLAANDSMQKNLNRFIRTTQQKLLQDKAISESIAQGVAQGEARRAISDKLLSQFREQLGNEQFITINGRNYRPDKYAELVARTRTREATTQGTINSCLDYGVDLVQISVHSGACPVCEAVQGKIYSISGNDPDFPQLDSEPPFHPNCEHVLEPITQESLRARGYYANAVRISNSPNTTIPDFKSFEEAMAGA